MELRKKRGSAGFQSVFREGHLCLKMVRSLVKEGPTNDDEGEEKVVVGAKIRTESRDRQ